MSSSSGTPTSHMPSDGQREHLVDLARDYGVTRLILLPRDPAWMHAYWEVAPYTWDHVSKEHGKESLALGRPVLRLHSTFRGNQTKVMDVDVRLDSRNWYVYSPFKGGAWRAELGLLLPDGRFILLASSNEIHLPNGQVSDIIDDKWGIFKAEWERIFELSGGGRLGAGSLDMARMLAQHWEFLMAVSSWPGSPGGASWGLAPVRGKRFWLVADTELLVYGATDPKAKVTVRGKPVPLNPDGTFSLRYPLPDGRLEIPIKAVNAEGDLSEAVQFLVTRKTEK